MALVFQILACFVTAGISLVTCNELFELRRYHTFTVPYTDKLIKAKLLPKGKRDDLLKEARIGNIVGVILSGITAVLTGWFMARPYGPLVFVLVVLGVQVFVHPDMTETPATRARYYEHHKGEMDLLKYDAFIRKVEAEERAVETEKTEV